MGRYQNIYSLIPEIQSTPFSIMQVPQPQNSLRIIRQASYQSENHKNIKNLSNENSLDQLHQKHTQMKTKILKSKELARFYRFLSLRLHLHYPLQLLTVRWPFRCLQLKLRRSILIPRFQTEWMVGIAIERIKSKWKKGSTLRFVDFGCGTGAIGLSIIKELSSEYEIRGIMLDLNPRCIALSKFNCKINGIDQTKVTFIEGDMLKYLSLMHSSNVILSNPPYLPISMKLSKQITNYEPKLALFGGSDGLQFVNALIYEWEKLNQDDRLMVVEYGGQKLNQKWQNSVKLDQYDRRRFIVTQK